MNVSMLKRLLHTPDSAKDEPSRAVFGGAAAALRMDAGNDASKTADKKPSVTEGDVPKADTVERETSWQSS